MGALFKKIVFVVLFAVLPTSCGIRDTKASNEGSSPIVVMAYYVPEKEYAPENLPLDQLTHIIFSFTQVIDGEMKFRNKRTGEKLRRMVAQRDKHPDLKIMVACGGWGADGFSDMAHTAGNRYKFVQSAVDFIEHYQLDGLDIDWEYPAIPAANTGARPEDKQNFTLLMTELREALNTLDRKQTLTFASAGWEPYYGNVELLKVMEQVDFMNVMTYDQIGGKSPYTGHHTALGHISEKDIQGTPAAAFVQKRREAMKNQNLSYGPRSAEKIVDYCLDNGVDPQKIVIGAAFYGRAWKGVPPENNGLYQGNSGAYIGWSAYHQIRREFETDKSYNRYWDSIAKAPYLYNRRDSIFISYDDTVSVRLKTEFAQKKGLGGIMFWELGNDTKEKNGLLQSIYSASQKNDIFKKGFYLVPEE